MQHVGWRYGTIRRGWSTGTCAATADGPGVVPHSSHPGADARDENPSTNPSRLPAWARSPDLIGCLILVLAVLLVAILTRFAPGDAEHRRGERPFPASAPVGARAVAR